MCSFDVGPPPPYFIPTNWRGSPNRSLRLPCDRNRSLRNVGKRAGTRCLATVGAISMKRGLLAGVALAALSVCNGAEAADTTVPTKAPVACKGVIDPYKNYACLDAYLGTTFLE